MFRHAYIRVRTSETNQPKDRLGVLNAAKVLADTAKKKVNTYTRRKRAVSTGSEGISTASKIFSTAEESVSIAGESMSVSTADVVQEERVPTLPHDSPLLRVNTLGSDEGSMSLQELTTLCTTLSDRVLALETDLRQTKKVYGTTYTKLIMKVKKLEKAVKSNQARRRTKVAITT
nr:hypothetical protein [Tanacetum cinerariifolium]